MTHLENDNLKYVELYPHQAQFIDHFLNPKAAPFQCLVAPTGTGKTHMIRYLVRQIIATRKGEHILILTRPSLVNLFKELCTGYTEGVPVIQIDKKIFRELVANVEVGINPWLKPIVAIMSIRLTEQEEIAESLKTADWDLVIGDEAQNLTRRNSSFINELIRTNRTHRLLLVQSTQQFRHDSTQKSLPIDSLGLERTEWSIPQLVDWNGEALFNEAISFTLVEYQRSPQEIEFLELLQNSLLPEIYSSDSPTLRLSKRSLLRAASSSLYAVEQTLAKQQHQLEQFIATRVEDGGNKNYFNTQEKSFDPVEALEAVNSLLGALDKITEDTKLQALLKTVADLKAQTPSENIFVFVSHISTSNYLSSSLSEIYPNVYQISGATALQDMNSIPTKESIVLASNFALKGIELSKTRTIVNYDIPTSSELYIRLSRVMKSDNVTTFFFIDKSANFQFEVEALHTLRFIPSKKNLKAPAAVVEVRQLDFLSQIGQDIESEDFFDDED